MVRGLEEVLESAKDSKIRIHDDDKRNSLGKVGLWWSIPLEVFRVEPSRIEKRIRQPEQKSLEMCIGGIPCHRHRMEVEAVLECSPEEEGSKGAVLVHAENCSVVIR